MIYRNFNYQTKNYKGRFFMYSNPKVLLIGYLPPPIGGVTVLFKNLVDDLNNYKDINIDIIDLSLSKDDIYSIFLHYIKLFFLLFFKIIKNDTITFHATTKSTFVLGPIILFLAKLFNKKIIFREFGGVFDKKYDNLNKISKFIINYTIFKYVDVWLFETKHLVNYFENKIEKKTKWYPNSRNLNVKQSTSSHAKKFVFISQIKTTKGIKEIYKVSNKLPSDIIIDIYGPLGHDIKEKELENLNNNYRAQYKRCLDLNEVLSVLSSYDVLLLPTYHTGEGYPGIILEAYSCGVPVISTNWNSIPEIVDQTSGILINPRNEEELFKAILKVYNNKNLFNKLQKGAIKKAKIFNSQRWSKVFYDLCLELIE
ncbi:glycosyltransferase family 4 protein [Halanaerobium congolense]|uniref:glycosyltransferase family 4 protein n=2 Tax=Halanaerobium congolense TaxID=54121 RepID=UPI0015D66D30|nr:glycosyltransferase [Halanaerobium congolense]